MVNLYYENKKNNHYEIEVEIGSKPEFLICFPKSLFLISFSPTRESAIRVEFSFEGAKADKILLFLI